MFFARPEPLELAGEDLLALRRSVNTPVVATAELPVGPARAAIAVHVEDGIPNVTVAIRSLRTDESVLYSFEGDLGSDSSVAVAVDAGLSFAETMGFLFDEEEVDSGEPASRSRALEHWSEVAFGAVPATGDAEEAEEDREQILDELANSLSEAMGSDGPEIMLELEEEVASELELGPEPAEPLVADPVAAAAGPAATPEDSPVPEPASPVAQAVSDEALPARAEAPPKPALSKFRGRKSPAPVKDQNESTQHALGRLKLVKKRRGRAASSEKPNPILRLLSSF